VRTKRSAIAFAFGARTGVLMTRMPSLAKTSSKARVNLLSRSRIRNRNRDGCSWRSKAELRTEVFDYIEVFYNRERRHSTLGQRSPADYEKINIPDPLEEQAA
jgi:transposase InsO family protein